MNIHHILNKVVNLPILDKIEKTVLETIEKTKRDPSQKEAIKEVEDLK